MTIKFSRRFLNVMAGYEKTGENLAAVRYETRECDCGLCKTGNYLCTTLESDALSGRIEVRYHHVYITNVEEDLAAVPGKTEP